MSNKYVPPGCDEYDIIEAESLKPDIKIKYFGNNNYIRFIKGSVKDFIISENREEFMVLKSGKKIRLDKIIEINGKKGPAFRD